MRDVDLAEWDFLSNLLLKGNELYLMVGLGKCFKGYC